jgi:hypothetical protein
MRFVFCGSIGTDHSNFPPHPLNFDVTGDSSLRRIDDEDPLRWCTLLSRKSLDRALALEALWNAIGSDWPMGFNPALPSAVKILRD